MGFFSSIANPIPAVNKGLGENLFISGGGEAAWQRTSNFTREQWAWLERMANTAHQREVADLRAAGLNPILSVRGSGAAVPNASSAQAQQGHNIAGAIATFVPGMRAAGAAVSQANSAKALRVEQGQTEFFRRSALSAGAERDREEADLADQQRKLTEVNTETAKAQLEAAQAVSKFAKERNLTEEQIEKSTYGRVLRWLGRLNPFGSSARDFMGAAGGVKALTR